MTDKEIIIDGVDVSECEFYCGEYCSLSNDRNECLPFAEKCTEYSDCCYKQFKYKEQECEELNRDNRYFVNQIISLETLINEQEQALDKIRQYRIAEINNEGEEENDTILSIIDEVKNGK